MNKPSKIAQVVIDTTSAQYESLSSLYVAHGHILDAIGLANDVPREDRTDVDYRKAIIAAVCSAISSPVEDNDTIIIRWNGQPMPMPKPAGAYPETYPQITGLSNDDALKTSLDAERQRLTDWGRGLRWDPALNTETVREGHQERGGVLFTLERCSVKFTGEEMASVRREVERAANVGALFKNARFGAHATALRELAEAGIAPVFRYDGKTPGNLTVDPALARVTEDVLNRVVRYALPDVPMHLALGRPKPGSATEQRQAADKARIDDAVQRIKDVRLSQQMLQSLVVNLSDNSPALNEALKLMSELTRQRQELETLLYGAAWPTKNEDIDLWLKNLK